MTGYDYPPEIKARIEVYRQAIYRDLEENEEKYRQDRLDANARSRANIHASRARRLGGGGRYTPDEWKQLIKDTGSKCLACGAPETVCSLEVDHIIPISKGGTSFIDNIQPLCMHCNGKKWTKIINYRVETGV